MRIRAIRVELAKPLDRSWDDFGQLLRDQRRLMHRLLNAAIVRCVIAYRTKEDGAVQTLAYREVGEELERFREWAAKQKEAHVQRLAGIDLPGGHRAAISATAYAQFQRWLKSRGEERLPSYKRGAPILVRAQEWSIADREGSQVLDIKLEPGRTGRVPIAVRASTGKHWQQLKAMGDGSVERGDCKIVYDARKRKWYGILAFKEEDVAPATLDPARALIVHRGMHNFLFAMSTTGQATTLMRGGKLVGQKRSLEARMRGLRAVSYAERGDGSRGHGRKRRYESYSTLDDKLARVIKTTCQQAAAGALRLAKQWGCGTIVIEEYGGIEPDEDRNIRRFLPRFPYYQLKQAIAWVCKREGLQLVEVPAQYVSTTCPRCGDSDERYHNHRTNIFHCAACGFERPADFVASLNMLRTAHVDSSIWDGRLERERKLAETARSA